MGENKVVKCDLVVEIVHFVHPLTLLYIEREQGILQDLCQVQLVVLTNLPMVEMIDIQEMDTHIQIKHTNKGEITEEKKEENIRK